MKKYCKQVIYAVPDDQIYDIRSILGQKLAKDPRLRELFPELSIGSFANLSDLDPVKQHILASKITQFIISRVMPLGATTSQLSDMVELGTEISTTVSP